MNVEVTAGNKVEAGLPRGVGVAGVSAGEEHAARTAASRTRVDRIIGTGLVFIVLSLTVIISVSA
jgi:hypothetical protein